jgi:hypothetical protein
LSSLVAREVLVVSPVKAGDLRARHQLDLSAIQTQAQGRIVTARGAKRLLEKYPRAAFWGAPYLIQIAADIQKARSGWETDVNLPPDWDSLPILDLWGIPYQPRPRGS